MTIKYENVYINETSTVTGPYEKKGPLHGYFDKGYDDFYFGMPTWEQAEGKLIEDSVDILLSKLGKTRFDIDLHISGDLLNQTVASNYAAADLGIPYLGIYNACATSVEGIIIGSNMIEAGQIKNCICSVSSHNNAAEKQFRYPVEYGSPKHKSNTFTATGCVACLLTNEVNKVKIESATIGQVINMGIKDVNNMGAVMAPAAASSIVKHLQETKRDANYYDIILTGDLGSVGSEILKEYMNINYKIKLKNHMDAGMQIYTESQDVNAGSSGPASLPLVLFNKILKNKKYKKILIVGTGSLHTPTLVNQKNTIGAIAHIVSLEVL